MAKKTDVEITIKANADEAEQTLDQLKKKGKKTFEKDIPKSAEDGNKKIRDSFRQLGISSEIAVIKANKNLIRSYLTLKKSGQASAKELKRAHKAMTDKIKSNNKKIITSNKLLSRSFKAIKSNIAAIIFSIIGLGVAIKKTFDFALRGGALKEQELAFRNLAASYDEDGDAILKSLKEVTKGTISTARLIKSANLGVILGIPINQMADLAKIAKAAARATGETVENQFNDIVKGIGRQSRLILDNLGIIVSVLVANKKLADSLGIQAKNLTDAQRRQAFLNEVIEKGNRINEITGDSYLSSADILRQFSAKAADAADSVAKLAAKIITLFAIDIQTFINKLKQGFIDLKGIIFTVTDAFGLTEERVETLVGETDKLKKKNIELAKTRKSVARSEKELTLIEKKLIKVRNEENAATLKLEQSIIAENEAFVKATKEKIENLKELGEINKKIQKELAQEAKFVKDVLEAELEATKSIADKSEDVLANSRKELGLLKTELEDIEDFTKSIQEQILQANRQDILAKAKEEDRPVIKIGFSDADLKEAQRLVKEGDFEEGRKLLNDSLGLALAVRSTAEVGSREFKDAIDIINEILGVADEMKKGAEEAVALKEEIVATDEAMVKLNNSFVKAAEEGLKDLAEKAKLFKEILKEDTESTHKQIIIQEKILSDKETEIPEDVRTTAGAKRMKDGGRVGNGFGGGDKVPIVGEAGEFMLKKEAVRNLGEANVIAMNNLQKPDLGGSASGSIVNVKLDVGGSRVNLSGSDNEVSKLVKQINNINIKKGRYESRF